MEKRIHEQIKKIERLKKKIIFAQGELSALRGMSEDEKPAQKKRDPDNLSFIRACNNNEQA